MEKDKYTIEDLSEITGYNRRTIRYYIQEGLLAPPAGRGRGGFYYDSHIQSLLKIKSMQRQGISIASMARFLEKEEPEQALPQREIVVRYDIAPGVEVSVSRDVETREQRKIEDLVRIARSIMKGEKGHE